MAYHEPMQRVFVAADEVQAESVRQALEEANVRAQVAVEPSGGGGMRLEIRVPASDAARAVDVIENGNWPRLV